MIKVLKIVTGEEVIGKLSETTISKPLIMVMDNNGKVSFAPWLISSKDEVSIKENAIIAESYPNDEAEQAYKSAIGE